MQELDKNKIYDLSELTSEEWKQLTNNEKCAMCYYEYIEGIGWVFKSNESFTKEVVNAKELFYTLDSIQVDCTNLTEEQIKEMCNVYESNGYKQWMNKDALKIEDNYTYLRIDWENEFCMNGKSSFKTIITYDKFMELFGGQEVLKPTLSQYFKNLTPIDNPPFIKADSLGYIGQIVDNKEESTAVTPEEIVKYLSKKDIFLTPKQYKKLWKGL